jgi:hypothetical protein
MEPLDAAAAAAGRADDATRRTQEIADRLTRLAAGKETDNIDVRDAQEHADQARNRARESLNRAAAGHERAALSHDCTAEAHE